MKIPINLKAGSVDKEEKKDVIIGIDLGTTNSCVSVSNATDPSAISVGRSAVEKLDIGVLWV